MAAIGKLLEGFDTAATLAIIGIDPFKFLNCKDDFERSLMQELAIHIAEKREIDLQNQAKRIAFEVSKLFSK